MSLLAQHRPRGIAEILDASIQFYRAHVGVLLVISIAVIFPPALIGAFAPLELRTIISRVGNIFVPVAQGAIALVVAAVLADGTQIGAAEAFRRLGKRSGEMVGVQIMSGIIIILGLILLVVPGIIAIVWTAVAGPVVAIEGVGSSAALSRSRVLARGLGKHVFGTLVLSWVIAFTVLFGLSFVVGLLSGVVGLGTEAIDFISEMLFAPILPLLSIPVVFLYYDLRVRSEGADIEAMVADLPGAVPVPESHG